MGLFTALFGGRKKPRSVETAPDQIWLTTDAKLAGLATEAIARDESSTVALLLVAHFPDVKRRLEELVAQREWHSPCMAVLASEMTPELAARLPLEESTTLDVLVAERHPLPAVDDQLEAFAQGLPCRCHFAHHISLEDAVIRTFAGESVQRVIQAMGMEPNESIQSHLVSRRIRKAQQRIAGKTFGTVNADSAAEWLEKNCPELASNQT